MNRIRDYMGFAIWFAGLGYIVLWPITAPDFDGHRFAASAFCGDDSTGLRGFLCNSVHPVVLPPALHVLGFISAIVVTARLLLFALKQSRTAGDPDSDHPKASEPQLGPRVSWRKRPRPSRAVKPRAQFGLRGPSR